MASPVVCTRFPSPTFSAAACAPQGSTGRSRSRAGRPGPRSPRARAPRRRRRWPRRRTSTSTTPSSPSARATAATAPSSPCRPAPAPSTDAPKSRGRFDKSKRSSSKKVSYKRNYDGSVALPMGGHGGDVVLYADEAEETLLWFHKKARYCAKRGGNVGATGTLSLRMHNGFAGETLRVPVPL